MEFISCVPRDLSDANPTHSHSNTAAQSVSWSIALWCMSSGVYVGEWWANHLKLPGQSLEVDAGWWWGLKNMCRLRGDLGCCCLIGRVCSVGDCGEWSVSHVSNSAAPVVWSISLEATWKWRLNFRCCSYCTSEPSYLFNHLRSGLWLFSCGRQTGF